MPLNWLVLWRLLAQHGEPDVAPPDFNIVFANAFPPAALKSLTKALALILGTESMIVFNDVLQVDDAEARDVRRWAIRALVEAAAKPG